MYCLLSLEISTIQFGAPKISSTCGLSNETGKCTESCLHRHSWCVSAKWLLRPHLCYANASIQTACQTLQTSLWIRETSVSMNLDQHLQHHTEHCHPPPKGCVLSPFFLLCWLTIMQQCTAHHIIKFTDDTIVVDLLSKNQESAYTVVRKWLTLWRSSWTIDGKDFAQGPIRTCYGLNC